MNMNMKHPKHCVWKTLLLTTLLAFTLGAVGCRRPSHPPVPGTDSVSTVVTANGLAFSSDNEDSGWFARLTGFQQTLAARSAQLAVAREAAKRAELEADAVRVQLEVQRESTHEARQGLSFWRVTACVLAALSLVAVFVGAALGSQARHQSQESHGISEGRLRHDSHSSHLSPPPSRNTPNACPTLV